ncbi:glycoside hydrolase family 43 protein [Kitasatospora sp. NPDC127059]|uniref:glycoside hydrolase family 43 protein n=1 Tax=unclassified Kitasatospora TaxID=2633591 RepID=UPI003646DF0A
MSALRARFSAGVLAFCLLFTALALAAPQRAAAAPPPTPAPAPAAAAATPGYLMVHFIGEGATGQQTYLSHSTDGVHWNDLDGGAMVLRSTVGTGGVRDQALVRSPDGSRYWILATDLCIGCGQNWDQAQNNASRNIVVWESTDLVTWSKPWLLDVAGAIPDGRNAWAPEAIWDPETNGYVLYWATNATLNGVLKHRIYAARTTDFHTITTPQLYIDRPGTQGVIDTQIIEVPSGVGDFRYVRASGDGQITLEGSDSILGTWTDLGNLSGIGLTGSQVEGPMWMKFNGTDKWALYLDQYATNRGYMPVVTTDPSKPAAYHRQASTDYDMGGTKKRHGWILNLTAAEESRVLARWPGTPAQRIQSFNFQDRYVRHANFDARIDPNVDPLDDSRFRLRPGLAGTGTVSFESVNFPGYFLRHVNYEFQLVHNDGTTQFAEDATFRQAAGLADPTWSSFRSYNHPDHYIRHYAFELRLDPITTATAQSDATFRVTS